MGDVRVGSRHSEATAAYDAAMLLWLRRGDNLYHNDVNLLWRCHLTMHVLQNGQLSVKK